MEINWIFKNTTAFHYEEKHKMLGILHFAAIEHPQTQSLQMFWSKLFHIPAHMMG